MTLKLNWEPFQLADAQAVEAYRADLLDSRRPYHLSVALAVHEGIVASVRIHAPDGRVVDAFDVEGKKKKA
jgi:hypothetical protein